MNELDNTTKKLISDPDKRRAWIKYRVHLTGRSMAQVAAAAGVKRSCLYSVFLKPYPRMEMVIATAIGLTPQVLFPERYNEDGLPTRIMGRPKKSITKRIEHTTKKSRRNVKDSNLDRQEAA